MLILVIDSWCISNKTALRWMPQNFINEKWTLVHVMAWCRQAPFLPHYNPTKWPKDDSPENRKKFSFVMDNDDTQCAFSWLKYNNINTTFQDTCIPIITISQSSDMPLQNLENQEISGKKKQEIWPKTRRLYQTNFAVFLISNCVSFP